MTSLQERIAHYLTGYVCGACKCSNNLGWSKPERQPSCECYQAAGEILAMVFPPEGPEREDLVEHLADAIADSAAEFGEWIAWSTADAAAKAALEVLIGNVKKEGRNE